MTGYAIGIDIGTTGTKCVLFTPGAGIVAQTSRPSKLLAGRPGFAEADPGQWLRNVHESIRELLSVSGVSAADVTAVSTSGMVPAIVAVKADGTPVRAAILQNDARADQEVQELRELTTGIDMVSLTGSAITQQSVAPTLLWLARHEPEVWADVQHVQGSYDWVLSQLGAHPHIERNWAIESGLFALEGTPLDSVAAAAGLDLRVIPPVAAPGTVVGTVSAEAARATGLSTSTRLVVGGADHVLSAFAAGVEGPGDWLVKLGGAGDILVASDRPITDSRLYLDAHPRPGHWLPNGCMATSGSLIRWFQSIVGGTDLLQLDDEAAARTPADVLCLPYFLGEKSPLHDPRLRGNFAGLHLGHTRADLYRSVLEAIAFGFRHHVEIFRELGVPLTTVRITNGGSRSTLWKQIHSEVLGTEMYPVVDHPGASIGAAILACMGTEVIGSWEEAGGYARFGDPVVPDPRRTEIYDEAYALWRELGDAMTPVSHRLAARSRR
ncbi:FGGY-family carbohydrate kinase [Streptomyces sp. NPDC056716]|uniref:FGGY-family carbohydrate kinase n=1 Tax=unclassified Streptomyces TaxID=2593676 RepID=UPI00369A67C9